MKKRNIAFSGVMAAILFSAGAANAATARIASQQYVDNKEGRRCGKYCKPGAI